MGMLEDDLTEYHRMRLRDQKLNKDQEDAIYAAYLGICVLQTMCRKAKLSMAVERSSDLLKEMGEAFPFIPERVGLSALRS